MFLCVHFHVLGRVLLSLALSVANILADVYSYPEDDSVLDPLLAQHLAHFGIDFSSMQKVSMVLVMNLVNCVFIKGSILGILVVLGLV